MASLRTVAMALQRGVPPPWRAEVLQRVVLTVKSAIEQATPIKDGHLKANTRHEILTTGAKGRIYNRTPYAVFVHAGTKPHVILPKFTSREAARTIGGGAALLAFQIGGRWVRTRMVRHPGTRANPFMRRGLTDARPSLSLLLKLAAADLMSELRGRP